MIVTAPPQVTLRAATPRPYDSAIAAARTCYSPRVVTADEVTASQRQNIGPLTFDAGHHTVWQHAHFEFGLENVSRQFVWSFLHSHPFYNSEQSSQRYVRLDEVRAVTPDGLDPRTLEVYQNAVETAWAAYGRLTEILKRDTLRIISEVRRLTPASSEARQRRAEREAERKAQEIARYVIPIGACTSLVHTVSGIVLHRLYRMMRTGDAPAETVRVVTAMVDRVKQADPDFFERIGDGPLPQDEVVETRLPRLTSNADDLARTLDARLGRRTSLLVDYSGQGEQTTADAVRAVMGASAARLPDDAALNRLMNPSMNRYRLETLDLSIHSPLTRALHHSTYTFLKRLSHTADSQDQRHRMIPASRPLMAFTDTERPDYLTPSLIPGNAEAYELFTKTVEQAWQAKNRLLEMGVPLEAALYVLPNAKALRFHETGNLLYLAHKWVLRTCFNAQEEIHRASMDEIAQVRAVHPRLALFIGPPCYLRAGRTTPTCTEGEHFCGVPVWRSYPNVERRL